MSDSIVPFLGAVEDVSAGNQRVPQSESLPVGELPVVDQGQSLIAGYTNELAAAIRTPGPVIVFGDHTRALKYVDFPFAMGADGVKVLRAREGFDPKFVYHYLRSTKIPSAGYSRHYKFLKEVSVPKPDLAEQRRIVAILDHADALRVKRRQVLAHLDALTQSIFHDMFGDPGSAMQNVDFGRVAKLAGGRNLVADDSTAHSPYRVLKISAVTTGEFKPTESKPLPPDYVPPREHLVRPGDLLMSRANTTELVGAVALVGSVPDNLALPDKVWRFEWKCKAEPTFYHALFSTTALRRRISRLSSGTGGSMKNVSKAKLETMPIPDVPIAEQRAFAQRVVEVSRQRQLIQAASSAEEQLFGSLQSRAFRGEL